MRRWLPLCLTLLLVVPGATKKFNLCCVFKAFNVEPCMIKEGVVLDTFSSKDKVTEFPILNSTDTLQCKMSSSEEASYLVNIASQSLSVMNDPALNISNMGSVHQTETKYFSMNFSCLKTQKTFVKAEVSLTFSDDDHDLHIFYLAKNCSLPAPPITNNKNTIILYAVCGVLATVLVLVIVVSVVCYIRIRRRSDNQNKNMGGGGVQMMGRPSNGYAPLPDNGPGGGYHPHQGMGQGGYPPQPYNMYQPTVHQHPNHSLPSLPSLHSSVPPKHLPNYGYSSGEGSFLSEPQHKMIGGGMLPPAYHPPNGVSDELKIHRPAVVFDTFLQSGAIGIVYLATYTRDVKLNQRSTVFAKTLKEEACTPENITAFLREAVILELVAHPNILSITGIVNDLQKPPIAIYPYMKGGNLHNLLHLARPVASRPNTLTLADQIHMMICVARGMEALSRKNVHGDLAARNCVVGNDLVVKIADSALSRDLYPNDYHQLPDRQGSPKLPIKWMAIECLTDLLYSTMSDVWAFGVTFWEVLTFGEIPYVDIAPESMVKHLHGGWRLMQPDTCTDELFALLVRCWSINPEDRLSFANILAQLEAVQCKGAMGTYRPSALEDILKPNAEQTPPSTTPQSDSDQIQV